LRVSISADDLIADVLRASPDHQPGTRPIHAPGIAVTGVFQATDAAARYSIAQHFSGQAVQVTVRFSNGTGQPGVADADAELVRGMAIRFHLGTGSQRSETDMVCMTLPVFFVKTVDRFSEFARMATPVAGTPQPWWRMQLNKLALRSVPADPPPGIVSAAAGLFDFARRYPPAAPAVVQAGLLSAPESYSTCSYHAVHAFVVTAGDGRSRAVRFHWEPVDGIRAAAADTKGDYLQNELEDRLDQSAVEFVLRMQLGEQGDDTADPTRAWPVTRPRVVMGHLLLDTLAGSAAEHLSFNPARLPPGIALSDDPILAARDPVYQRSFVLRSQRWSSGPPAPPAVGSAQDPV